MSQQKLLFSKNFEINEIMINFQKKTKSKNFQRVYEIRRL